MGDCVPTEPNCRSWKSLDLSPLPSSFPNVSQPDFFAAGNGCKPAIRGTLHPRRGLRLLQRPQALPVFVSVVNGKDVILRCREFFHSEFLVINLTCELRVYDYSFWHN